MIFDVFGHNEFDAHNTKERWIKSCTEYEAVYGESNRTKALIAEEQPKVKKQGKRLVVVR